MDVEQVISKYIELRDRKAELAKKQSEEMKPLTEAMDSIENYILHQLNATGAEAFKTKAGTAFKAVQRSVQLQDPIAFKDFVFAPAATGVTTYLASTGIDLQDVDKQHIAQIIRDLPMWDMVDFRVGKKGITDYQENDQGQVPGVALNSTTVINIRRV
jgi:hypothetical protein